jgi:hypothetical protein
MATGGRAVTESTATPPTCAILPVIGDVCVGVPRSRHRGAHPVARVAILARRFHRARRACTPARDRVNRCAGESRTVAQRGVQTRGCHTPTRFAVRAAASSAGACATRACRLSEAGLDPFSAFVADLSSAGTTGTRPALATAGVSPAHLPLVYRTGRDESRRVDMSARRTPMNPGDPGRAATGRDDCERGSSPPSDTVGSRNPGPLLHCARSVLTDC